MEQETKRRQLYREIMVLLIIVMIGILVRLPIGRFDSIIVTQLNDPDSFLYARKALELYELPLSNWHISFVRANDPLMNSVYLDNQPPIPLLLSVIAAFICKIFRFLPVNSVIFYFNSVFCPLSAVPTFIFVKKHSNQFGGFVAALLMAITPAYFFHTLFGVFDTDGLIMVLALTFMLCFFESFLENSKKAQLLYVILAFIFLFILSLSWTAFYYYVAIAGITLFATFLFSKRKDKFMIPFFGIIAFVLYCFVKSPFRLKNAIIDFFAPNKQVDTWPDKSKYISELERPVFFGGGLNSSLSLDISETGFVNWMGGLPVLLLFVFVSLFLLKELNNSRKNKTSGLMFDKDLLLAVLTWGIITALIAHTGIRFVQLFVLPLNIYLGYILGTAYFSIENIHISQVCRYLLTILTSIMVFASLQCVGFSFALYMSIAIMVAGLIINDVKVKNILALFLVSVMAFPITCEYQMTKGLVPYYSPDVLDASEYISTNTPKDAVIVSWWGDGYYYQYSTKRQVVADGGIYNGAYFYYLGNVFTTENETLSKGICRLFSSGSIEPVKLLEDRFNSKEYVARVLNELLVLNKTDAEKLLIDDCGFSNDEAKELVSYSHPENQLPIYIVITREMMQNIGAIGYFGLWNFKEEKEYGVLFDTEKDKFIPDEELQDCVLVRLYDGDESDLFEEVYSNNTVSIFRVR